MLREGEKKRILKERVTNKKTDDRVSLVEGLTINCRSFGYKTKISLIGSQSLRLEYVVPQNFVGLVIVRVCQFLDSGQVRFVFIQEEILQDLGKLISKIPRREMVSYVSVHTSCIFFSPRKPSQRYRPVLSST